MEPCVPLFQSFSGQTLALYTWDRCDIYQVGRIAIHTVKQLSQGSFTALGRSLLVEGNRHGVFQLPPP